MAQLLSGAKPEQHGRLRWYDIGIGWLHVAEGTRPYDRAYFDKYVRYAGTELGRQLTHARIEFVARHYQDYLCDVGIGSGTFIEARGRTYGYDICPAGVEWLQARKLLVDPYRVSMIAVSLWDVLEHIPDFWRLLRNVEQWVFLSLPIFTDADHALRSKHFRPDEHCWYFTRDGLLRIMHELGFRLIEENNMETQLGREDIGSFAFCR
jgi:hypothetical protein